MPVTPASLAPTLGARRDGQASVDTSRGLLMTILGEFVLPHGGQAWTQTLVALMEQLGVREKATRQALARMAEKGFLERQRHGRQTRWSLSPQATDLLGSGAPRIYGFGQSQPVWDEQWVLLLASIPERDRRARYRMAVGLNWAGFGSLGQGIWISPWQHQEQPAVTLLQELGVQATSFVARVGEYGSGVELAHQGWDLPTLRSIYREFLNDTEPVHKMLAKNEVIDGLAAGEQAGLVHRWRRFPFLDPDLPADVLPADWPGPAAAERFSAMRASLTPAAMHWWQSTEALHRPSG